MYNYIIRCVETLLLTVRVVIITFFFLTRYIASIKYVYNKVTHLLLESALNITCNALRVVCLCIFVCFSYVFLCIPTV